MRFTQINTLKGLFTKFCVAVSLITLSTFSSASLMNADFSDGLNSWTGELTYFDDNTGDFVDLDSETTTDFFNDYGNLFSVVGNKVTLKTFFDDIDGFDFYSLTLFQEFVVDVTSDTKLFLDFLFEFDVSDQDEDLFQLDLVDVVTGDIIDLVDLSTFDLTSFNGKTLALQLFIEDGDLVSGDFVSLSNIALREVANDIPAPSLAFASLLILAVVSRKRLIKKA
jgi:hypothetical protein